MNNIQLGKKIKEARLSKKMTQSDVVGTFITRNMLSQIESGAASPSLRTLEYLAHTLEIPVHYLISEEASSNYLEGETFVCQTQSEIAEYENASTVASLYLKCKTAFLQGNFEYVIKHAVELDNKESLYYDESAALLARAYLKFAEHAVKGNRIKDAIANARLAARYGEVGVYASREVRTEAVLLLEEVAQSTI